MKSHKYKAIAAKCAACGASHPSKKEARRCGELHLLQRGGVIRDLRTQVAFPLFGMGGFPPNTVNKSCTIYRENQ